MKAYNFEANPLTVLVAEDDPDDRLIIERAFGMIGFPGSLHFFENGEELLERLPVTPSRPACILLDLNMPLMDGRRTLHEIRRYAHLDDIVVVVITTSDSKIDKDFCAQYSSTVFITKPPSLKQLAVQLSSLECINRFARHPEKEK